MRDVLETTRGTRGYLGGAAGIVLLMALLIAMVVGCYNVTYEMIEGEETDGLEVPKPFLGIGEITHYSKNGGQLVLPAGEDASGQDSIQYNHKYRIPTSVVLPPYAVLPNGQTLGSMGRIVVAGDARWGDTGFGGGSDGPQKASAWTRFSDDGGKTWSRMELAVHYDDLDMKTFQNKSVRMGVFTADPSIGRTAGNRIIMLSTFGLPYGGLYGTTPRMDSKYGNSYFQTTQGDEWNRQIEWYLRLRKNTKNYGDDWKDTLSAASDLAGVSVPPVADSFSDDDWKSEEYNADNSEYTYYVNVKGGQIMKGTGNGKTGGTGTGLYVDEFYYLYLDAGHKYPLYVKQLVSDGTGNDGKDTNTAFGGVKLGEKDVHCHLFMALSPFLPWRGCNYIGMSYSDDGGVTWSKHKDITYMVRPKASETQTSDGVFFVSPTGGYLHEGIEEDKAASFGNNKRLLFSAYCSGSSGSRLQACVFWTDDEGETWEHAGHCINDGTDHYIGTGTTMFSETTIVGHPDGTLLAIGRGSPPQYAVSKDGGRTWEHKGNLSTNGGIQYANNNLMSAARLVLSESPTGDPLVAISCAANTNPRQDGNVFIMSIKNESGEYSFDPLWNGGVVRADITTSRYDYSNVQELPDGNLMVLWEANECNDYMLSFVEVLRQD